MCPNSLDGNSVEPTAGVSLTSSHDGGRPPESIPHVTFNQPLERVGSPLAVEDQPVVKRGQNDSVAMDTMEVSESMEMEADVSLSTKEREAPAGDASTGAQPRGDFLGSVLRKASTHRETCPQLSKSDPPVNATASNSTVTGPALESYNITSSKELFGPWMVVDNRRHRTPSNKPSGERQDLVVTEPRGSRFAVLDSGCFGSRDCTDCDFWSCDSTS
ncbi:hypothetical protein V6N13_025429 [Hibiscus sabdariffa]